MTIESIGLGAGTRELPEQANIVRLFVGTVDLPPSGDRVWVLETNLDDLPGEVIGYCFDLLFAAGALDVWTTPIAMKKNRPGVLLSVIAPEGAVDAIEEVLFRETQTFGIRRHRAERHKLKRETVTVETPWGPVKGKLGWRDGKAPLFTPEYEDCARIARQHGVSLKEVLDRAAQAGSQRGKDAP